jgi:hypothetical protein
LRYNPPRPILADSFFEGGNGMKKSLVVLAALAMVAFVAGAAMAQEKAPTTVTLKATNGNVTFDHAKHSKMEGVKCEQCHHASKPEHPAKSAHEACGTCHTKPATAPMKTATMNAFHVAMAKSGTCIDCHTKQAAGGKKAPLKCPDCHKKA